ncbi:MAG: peptide deformylase [Alphaproteobacteria bacterium]|nr:peptide deformylase [Rickettsiales bacterium]
MGKILKIHLWPELVLKRVADEINIFDDSYTDFLSKMSNLMRVAGGIGLAAPQVGISSRFFIMLVNNYEKPNDSLDQIGSKIEFFGNPTVDNLSSEKIIFDEGCLSLPNNSVLVERYKSLTVKYFNEKGQKKSRKLCGIEAICFQHENDHLNGITILDKLSLPEEEIDKIKQELRDKKKHLSSTMEDIYT